MVRTFLLLGSNQGNRIDYLDKARHQISLVVGKLIDSSSVYETAAWGNQDQPSFLNQVIKVETTMKPDQLLTTVGIIEDAMGRIRTGKWSARTIDIDILFYGDLIIQEPELTVPHPAIAERRFTLVPLVEIEPGLVHPLLKKSMEELLLECKDVLEVKKYISDQESKN